MQPIDPNTGDETAKKAGEVRGNRQQRDLEWRRVQNQDRQELERCFPDQRSKCRNGLSAP